MSHSRWANTHAAVYNQLSTANTGVGSVIDDTVGDTGLTPEGACKLLVAFAAATTLSVLLQERVANARQAIRRRNTAIHALGARCAISREARWTTTGAPRGKLA